MQDQRWAQIPLTVLAACLLVLGVSGVLFSIAETLSYAFNGERLLAIAQFSGVALWGILAAASGILLRIA